MDSLQTKENYWKTRWSNKKNWKFGRIAPHLTQKIERLDKQHDKTLRSILNIEERFEKERIKNMED